MSNAMYTITVSEAATGMGVSRQYINQIIKMGRLRAIKRGPLLFIHRDDLRRFRSARQKKFEKAT